MSKTPKIKRRQFLAGAVAAGPAAALAATTGRAGAVEAARPMGVYPEGPIENPSDLAPALARAMAVVKKGEPALIDVVSQPR